MNEMCRRLMAALRVLLSLAMCSVPATSQAEPFPNDTVHEECRRVFYRELRLAFGTHELRFRLTPDDQSRIQGSEETLPELFDAILRILYPREAAQLAELSWSEEPGSSGRLEERYLDLCETGARAFVDSLFVTGAPPVTGSAMSRRSDESTLAIVLRSLGLAADESGAGQPVILTEFRRADLEGHWGLELGHLVEAHLVTRGAGVRVAVIGSGIDRTSELVEGLNLDLSASTSLIGPSGPPWQWDTTDLDDPTGTGTVMAALVGLFAPEAEIIALRVQEPDSLARPYWHAMQVAQAIYRGVAEGADIIAVGVGFGIDFDFLREATTYAYENNVVVVAPTLAVPGATPDRKSSFPADYNTTVAVAGLLPREEAARPWEGSGSSHFTTVAAPSTLAGAGAPALVSHPRLSWAPAMTAGLVSLIASRIEPTATELRGQYFQRIYEVLTKSANPHLAGANGFDPRMGYGVIDAADAVGPATETYLARMREIEEAFASRLKQVNERPKETP